MRKITKKEIELKKSKASIKKDVTSDYIVPSKAKSKLDVPIRERTKSGVYWITGCSHCPWENKKMYDSTFNFISKEIVKLQGIILGGDIEDLNSLSGHDRGRIPVPGVTLDWEYKGVNKFLDKIDQLNAQTVDYQYGNHTDRYFRAIKELENSKLGDALISPMVGLRLIERGYNVLTDWKNDYITLGKFLDVNHGEFCNIHTAKKTMDTYRRSSLYFHTHRFQVYVEGQMGSYNMGSGADFNAPIFGYATRAMKSSWMNSSALVTVDKDGFYHVQPLLYINNKLIINGKSY